MRNSFLLSSAAVLVSVTAASAADLPSKKAAPVEYVKICKIGSDFVGFVLPGSDTCIKLGGFGRFETNVTPTFHNRTANVTAFSAVGSLNAEARSQTELGTLTGYARIDVNNSGGAAIDSAYAALGGFKAGFFGSAYKFYDGAFGVGSAFSPAGAGNKPVQLQYALPAGPATFSVALEGPQRANSVVEGGTLNYAGQRVPDVVAALDATLGIATVHLGLVAHQVSFGSVAFGAGSETVTVLDENGDPLDVTFATPARTVSVRGVDSKWGFAVLGGVKAAFTPADTLYLEAAYTSGATSRSESWGGGFKNLGGLPTFGDFAVDADNKIKLVDTFYGLAAFQHAWSPNFSTFVSASYLVIEPPKLDNIDPGKLSQIKLALGATWNPVKNLAVSPEIGYIVASADKKAQDTFGLEKKSESNFTARLRVQRDF